MIQITILGLAFFMLYTGAVLVDSYEALCTAWYKEGR